MSPLMVRGGFTPRRGVESEAYVPHATEANEFVIARTPEGRPLRAHRPPRTPALTYAGPVRTLHCDRGRAGQVVSGVGDRNV